MSALRQSFAIPLDRSHYIVSGRQRQSLRTARSYRISVCSSPSFHSIRSIRILFSFYCSQQTKAC
ncbi:hypothetical protein HMPREF1985_00009 [Mitsuokella sp. oral taxon 131 str. W9106]|nr:hypothetical protein HMPREF1985_00009 [Mitsuokella sp. oral taxon 131 str. W9106]